MRRRLLLGAGLALPPFVFFGWMLGRTTLGNDYVAHPAPEALTLRFYAGCGLEPLFYPHQTGGIPVGGLFFAQYFHLPAWLSSRLPGFWDGEALRWITARHLLLLFAAQALYYAALRRGARLSAAAAYVLSFLAVYNLRTLDGLRYSLAFEATVYAHAVVLLSALHVLASSSRGVGVNPPPLLSWGGSPAPPDPPSWRLLPVIAVAAHLLVTSSYPVVLPFAALGALLLVPALLAAGPGPGLLLRRGLEAALAAALGVLLAAPQGLALLEWMTVNDRRVARADLDWAAAWAMEPRGVLENVVYPWTAEVHSAFGGPTLLVVAGLALVFALARAPRRRAFLLLLAVPLLYALGAATPVFPFFFERVPGFSYLRVPGRVLALLPLLAFGGLLAMRSAGGASPEERLRSAVRPAAAVALGISLLGLALVALRSGSALGGAGTHEYSAATLSDFWSPGRRAAWLFLGALTAGSLLLPRPRLAAVIAALATVAQTGTLMRHGTWTAKRPRTASRADFAAADHLPLYGGAPLVGSNFLEEGKAATATVAYARFLKQAGRRANCYLPIDPALRDRGVLLPFYLSPNLTRVRTTAEALALLSAGEDCREPGGLRTLVTDPGCAAGPVTSPAAGSRLAALNEGNRLVALTPNLAALETRTEVAAVLVTPFPNATSNWSAFLDGAPVPIVEVNGGFVGARVPPGRHEVEVRYFSPAVRNGYRLAFATALALVLLGGRRVLHARATGAGRRAAAILLLVAIGAASFGAYRRWERGFVERATRRALLPNSYPQRLAEQLARWRGPAPSEPGSFARPRELPSE